MLEPLIKTREKICEYVGEDRNEFLSLIENYGLPAWRTKPNGLWKARRTSLDEWLERQEKIYLQKPCQ
jgi:hypothetical protein